MRIIALIAICLYIHGADLVTVEMQKGVSWTGYYDSDTRLLSIIKPQIIVSIPDATDKQEAAIAPNETPDGQLARGQALSKLAVRVEAESGVAKTAERKKLIHENAEKYATEGGKIIENAKALQQAMASTTEGAEKSTGGDGGKVNAQWGRLIAGLEEAESKLTIADSELKRAKNSLHMADEAIVGAFAKWMIENADLQPIVETIQAGTKGSESRINKINAINNWMERMKLQVAGMKDSSNDGMPGQQTQGDKIEAFMHEIRLDINNSWSSRDGECRLNLYGEMKGQPWINDLVKRVGDTHRTASRQRESQPGNATKGQGR